jgi:hypothetical protein
MNPPASSQPTAKTAAEKARRRHPPRRHHQQPYRRTSAVIDDRPDGKPIIFGYGRHLSKKEKDRVKQRIAYLSLGLVVVVSVAIIAFAAIYNAFIYPNQTVASVNGHGISRHDRDTFANYATASASAQQQQLPTDATTYATETLQKQLLTKVEAAQLLHVSLTSADLNAEMDKEIKATGQGQFNQFLSNYGISKSDYENMILAPQMLRSKIGTYLTRGNPKVADQWHYARLQVQTQKEAQAILSQLVPSGTGPISKTATFASIAKAKSLDTQTKDQGGDLGWQRVTDSGDPLLVSLFLPVLKQMEKSHTKYKIVPSNKQFYVVEYLGHDPKHALSQTQMQSDQTAAFNTWYGPLETKAHFDPALPANSSPNGATQIQQPTNAGNSP